jgi:hypothetical protein
MDNNNTFREIELKNRVMRVSIFQEKKEILDFTLAKQELFDTLLFLKKYLIQNFLDVTQIHRIIKEIKYISNKFE